VGIVDVEVGAGVVVTAAAVGDAAAPLFAPEPGLIDADGAGAAPEDGPPLW
jgi:hypothetical protein